MSEQSIRQEIENWLRKNLRNSAVGKLVDNVTVTCTGPNEYLIHFTAAGDRVSFRDYTFHTETWPQKKARKQLMKCLADQKDSVAEQLAKDLPEKFEKSLKRWKKEHPFSKKDKEFLAEERAKICFSTDAVNALSALAGEHQICISRYEMRDDGKIVVIVDHFPYTGLYDQVSGKFTSPLSQATTYYNRLGQAERDTKTLEGIRSYLKEKGVDAAVTYMVKDPGAFYITFNMPFSSTSTRIVTEGVYKKLVADAVRKAKEQNEKIETEKERVMRSVFCFGTFLAEAVICTVLENSRSRTRAQITDILRGVRLGSDCTYGKHTGMYSFFGESDIESVISVLIRAGVLRERGVDGFYRKYDVVCSTKDTDFFQELQTKVGSIKKPSTEQEYRAYLERIVENGEKLSLKKEKALIDVLGQKPGIFCSAPHTAMDAAEAMSDEAKAYIKEKAGKSDGISARIMKYLYGAACGKRKNLPRDGFEVEEIKKEQERKKQEKKKKEQEERERKGRELYERILTKIPDNYVDLYPLARTMKRHFILHIGPTNSGKTYEAVKDLILAKSGIYLAPLRLLAFEQYEKMNREGCPCSLVTGEEQYIIDGAWHQSSTVEMLDIHKSYDVAVIDEAQMIADKERGGAWAAAIMGVRAQTVHVCAAIEAKNLLKRIITDCGDEYEIVEHERKTPLVYENKTVKFPKEVQPGDALIVFSRRNVHAVASELQRVGKKCSIIYGALPYDVRHRQAQLFASGETDIVVATDAIGMGMNLPIRRVVLMETRKFDGTDVRHLLPEEIRQITGRAGRYGIYDTGYAATANGDNKIRNAIYGEPVQLQKAVIGFPESLLTIDATMVELLDKWAQVVPAKGWERESIEQMQRLAAMVAKHHAPKRLEYDFLTIPFDDENAELLDIWYSAFKTIVGGSKPDVYGIVQKMSPSDGEWGDAVSALEAQHRILDLYFNIARKFCPDKETLELIMEKKRACSEKIMKILEKKKLKGRRCKYCGRSLPWNYPYGMCDACHSEMYTGYKAYW